MKRYDLFKTYIWLVNTIHQAGSISFKEINQLWVKTELSEGMPMSRSSFNRHKDAIQDIFGIIIDCDHKNGYKFYICNDCVLHEDSVQNWMLSTITVSNVIRESVSLQNRIMLENIPSSKGYLQTVLEAMKNEVKLSIEYKKYSAATAKSYLLAPYCLKLYRQRWYLLGRLDYQSFRVFSLDRMEHVEPTKERFKMDSSFNAEDFFHDYFGVFLDENIPRQRVVLRAYGNERFYLHDLPLHHSQKEIDEHKDYSDFEYYLRPSDDFIDQIVLQGSRIKVLTPDWMKDKICEILSDTLNLYEKNNEKQQESRKVYQDLAQPKITFAAKKDNK